jgi:ABC-type phosphate transport system substrate-binding protein
MAKVPGVEGSGGVAKAARETMGSIGCISSDCVAREGLNAVQLRDRRGQWVSAGVDALRATIAAGERFRHSLDAAR